MTGPQELDPIRFCELQIDRLVERQRAVEALLKALQEQRVDDVRRGVELVLEKLTNDHKYGSTHYTAAADHMGRHWYDRAAQFLGSWVARLIGGAALVAVLVWYVGTTGVKK